MFDLKTILFTSVCSLVAAMVGAFVVHRLTKSREHQVWVRDRRLREWQELLEAMARAYMTHLTVRVVDGIMTYDNNARQESLADVDVVIATRIFIAGDVNKLDVRMKWAALVTEFHKTGVKPVFKEKFHSLRTAIVDTAASVDK